MRTLSEAMAALLKSRKQIGANKPSYSLAISGLSSGIDWDSMGTVWRVPKSTIDAGGVSVEVKTNGKLIVCGMQGGAVYEGEVADVDTLLGADDTVTGWATTGITTSAYGRCHLFQAEGLYLSVLDAGTSSVNASLQIYKSPSGNGGDWELYSTVYSNASNDLDYIINGYDMPGGFTILPTGRWVLGGVYWREYFRRNNQPRVWVSDDKGETWTATYTQNFDYLGGCTSADIVRLNTGTLFWAFGTGSSLRILKSTDDGSTWDIVYTLATDTPYIYMFNGGSLYFDSNGDLLVFSGGVVKRPSIYKLTQPETDGTFEILKIMPLIYASGYHPTYMTNVGASTLLVSGKCVLAAESIITQIPVKSIAINRNKNMAASLDILIDNTNGEWSPDGTTHNEILWPNKVVTLQQGYGTDLVTTFTGLIDKISMTNFPAEIVVSCRDYMKYLLDQLVTKAVEGGNTHILNYKAQTVEAIVTDLVTEAGLTLAETVYTTGITVDDITFSWCSWADAIQELADLVGADFGCDETGKFYFRKDYIADTPTIAYVFKEGEDILSLSYEINDADICQKVVCYGTKTDGTSCFAQTNYTSRVYYNVLPNKYMKIDAGSAAQTAEAAQLLTNRAEILMRSRVRICQFAAIAVPQLQIGDVIQVIETSSTISEAYRVTDLSTTMDDTYTTMITCYHHSYTA